MNNIKIGDKVIINNGIKGKVVTIHSDNLSLAIEIAPNVKINVLKSGITAINPDAKAESQTKEINKSEEPKSESTKTKRKVPQRKVQKSNKPEPKNNTN
jgi:sRNA-binding carbon storage regulator CsrA